MIFSVKDSKDHLLALFTIVTLAISAGSYFVLHGSTDPARCTTLLTDGSWLDPARLLNWQPTGCMLHPYRPTDASACLSGRSIAFIGGPPTRALYQGMISKLDASHVPMNPPLAEVDQAVTVAGVRVEFVWDPTLSSPRLQQILAGTHTGSLSPALAVVGLSYEQLDELTGWASKFGTMLSHLRHDDADGEVRFRPEEVVLVPLFAPNTTQMSLPGNTLITPDRVMAINSALWAVAQQHALDVAFAFNQVISATGATEEGFMPVSQANAVLADVLLNFRCNRDLPKHYPHASTCCNNYPRVSWVQIAGFAFVLVFLPIAWLAHRWGHSTDSSPILRFAPPSRYHVPMLIVGLAVVLCYLCDRTNVFGKEQKQTSPLQFFVIMTAVIGGSMLTLKTSDKEQAFLNRDQTDEWKGWMQVAILVYHYVGVSKTPYIYQYVRVLPTSYLFMTGFGHTCYFLKKDDYSFKRFVATMLRLNLLNVLLAYAMGNDWLLYYFAPLVTWNFLVIYGLLWVGHKYNKNLQFVFAKMLIAAMLNTAFYQTPGLLEACWSVLQTLFRMEGDIGEWRFRVTLDQYSVFPGMIGAILFLNWSSFSLPKSTSWTRIESALVMISAIIVVGYAAFESMQESKIVYNQKHPYVAWLPCCAFVVARNGTAWLRRTHSSFFAWVGRGSLETFLLQFHIWLAADTAGLLVIGPAKQRSLNAALTTVIFLWVSNQVTMATGPCIEWIMGAESKPRPQLPLAQAASTVLRDEAASESQHELARGQIASSVPVNGQPADVKVQDPEKLEEQIAQLGSAPPDSRVMKAFATARKDLRVRIALLLIFMVFLNWTC